MEGTAKGYVSRALFKSPLNSLVINYAESIEVILREKVLRVVELFRFLKSAKQVVRLPDCNDGVTRAGRRQVSCLFDLLPSDRGRLNRTMLTIQTMRYENNDKNQDTKSDLNELSYIICQ